MTKSFGKQSDGFSTMSFHITNALAVGLQKSSEIFSSFSQECRGRFNRNWQGIIDDIGPVSDSLKSSLFCPEPIGSRQQCRTYFPFDQKIKSFLIALGQLQYQICPDLKLRLFAEGFCYRRISRWALSTNNSLSFEITDLSNRRTGDKIVRATIHHAAENPGGFGIQKVLQRSSPDN